MLWLAAFLLIQTPTPVCHTPDQLTLFYGQDDWGADLYDGGQAETVLHAVLEPTLGPAPGDPPALMIVGFDPKRGIDFFFYDKRACGYLHAGPFKTADVLAAWPSGVDRPVAVPEQNQPQQGPGI